MNRIWCKFCFKIGKHWIHFASHGVRATQNNTEFIMATSIRPTIFRMSHQWNRFSLIAIFFGNRYGCFYSNSNTNRYNLHRNERRIYIVRASTTDAKQSQTVSQQNEQRSDGPNGKEGMRWMVNATIWAKTCIIERGREMNSSYGTVLLVRKIR